MKSVLVIGGAGFIGSHLVDKLIIKHYEVIVYDNLESQVHGNSNKPPNYLSKNIRFLHNDIRNKETLKNVVKNVDIIIHLAAMVGVGQSMYQIEKYYDTNVIGTAKLLDILVNESHDVKKLIVASSMSTYGEGAYNCNECGNISPKIRSISQLKKGDWDMFCPTCGKIAKPIPTPESKSQDCTSIYALTKKEQEKMCLIIGDTYGIDTTALRIFNVYGSRQSLSNPYTGVCAIFSANLLCNNSPIIYEDGNQTRDFVHIKDVCQAFLLSLERKQAKGEVFNVGTGKHIKIKFVSEILAEHINSKISPTITYKFRPGDIRHCYSDISKISSKLGYIPKFNFEDGVIELINWVKMQKGKVKDKSNLANKELHNKGLIN